MGENCQIFCISKTMRVEVFLQMLGSLKQEAKRPLGQVFSCKPTDFRQILQFTCVSEHSSQGLNSYYVGRELVTNSNT